MRRWCSAIINASLMLGCEARVEQVGIHHQLGETSTPSSAVSSAIDTGASSPATTTLECLGFHEQACKGECVDITADPRNCSCCGCSCGDGERCHKAECEAPLTCETRAVSFDAALLMVNEMAQDASAPANDSVALAPGQQRALTHPFQSGPAVIVIVARAGAPRAGIGLEIFTDRGFVSRVPIRSSRSVTYRVELPGDGVSMLMIGATAVDPADVEAGLFIERVEIHECEELHRSCPEGGAYLAEESACVPLVCDTVEDCNEHFASGGFSGECRDGQCVYPTCTAETPETFIRCLDAKDLSDPRRNPSSPNDIYVEDFSECPDIGALRWIVEPFRGEGSCAYWPICGPNPPELFGYPPAAGECCYAIGDMCGV